MAGPKDSAKFEASVSFNARAAKAEAEALEYAVQRATRAFEELSRAAASGQFGNSPGGVRVSSPIRIVGDPKQYGRISMRLATPAQEEAARRRERADRDRQAAMAAREYAAREREVRAEINESQRGRMAYDELRRKLLRADPTGTDQRYDSIRAQLGDYDPTVAPADAVIGGVRRLSNEFKNIDAAVRAEKRLAPKPPKLSQRVAKADRYAAHREGLSSASAARAESPMARAAFEEIERAVASGDIERANALMSSTDRFLAGKASSISVPGWVDQWDSVRAAAAAKPKETHAERGVRLRGSYSVNERLRKLGAAFRALEWDEEKQKKNPNPAFGAYFKAKAYMAEGDWQSADAVLESVKREQIKTIKKAVKLQERINRSTEELLARGSTISAFAAVGGAIRQGVVGTIQDPQYGAGQALVGLGGGVGQALSRYGAGMALRAPGLLSGAGLAGMGIAGAGFIVSTVAAAVSSLVDRGKNVIERTTQRAGSAAEAFGLAQLGSQVDLRSAPRLVFTGEDFRKPPDPFPLLSAGLGYNPWAGQMRRMGPTASIWNFGSGLTERQKEILNLPIEYSDISALTSDIHSKRSREWHENAWRASVAMAHTRHRMIRRLAGTGLGMSQEQVAQALSQLSAGGAIGLPDKLGWGAMGDIIALGRSSGAGIKNLGALVSLQAKGYLTNSFGVTAYDLLGGAAGRGGVHADVLWNAAATAYGNLANRGLYGDSAPDFLRTVAFASNAAGGGVSGDAIAKAIVAHSRDKTSAYDDIMGWSGDLGKTVTTMLALRKGPLKNFKNNVTSITEGEKLAELNKWSPFFAQAHLESLGMSTSDAAKMMAANRADGGMTFARITDRVDPSTYAGDMARNLADAERATFAEKLDGAKGAAERLELALDKVSAKIATVFNVTTSSSSFVPSMYGDHP